MVTARSSTRSGTDHSRTGGSGLVVAIQCVRWSCHETLPPWPMVRHAGGAVGSADGGTGTSASRFSLSQRAGDRSLTWTVPSAATRR